MPRQALGPRQAITSLPSSTCFGTSLVRSRMNACIVVATARIWLATSTLTMLVTWTPGKAPQACWQCWQSARQMVVSVSSCEAKYITSATTTCEGVWLARPLGVMLNQDTTPTLIFVDNKSAIFLCKNPVLHDNNKHMISATTSYETASRRA